MLTSPWDYSVAIYQEDWTPVGQAHLDPDWEPAREWVRLSALNEGAGSTPATARMCARFGVDGAAPAVAGFRLAVATEGMAAEAACDFPARYLRDLAPARGCAVCRGGPPRGRRHLPVSGAGNGPVPG